MLVLDGDALDADQWEDQSSREARWRQRDGTMAACRLQCDDGLPPANATPQQLIEYQQRMLNRGKGKHQRERHERQGAHR